MKKIVNFRPMVCCGLSIAAGIIYTSFFVFQSVLWALIPIGTGSAIVVLFYVIKRKPSVLILGGICIALFAVGSLSVGIAYSSYGALKKNVEGAVFEGTVRSIVTYYEEGNETCVLIADISSDDVSVGNGRVIANVKGRCEIGDRYLFRADLEKIDLTRIDTFYFPERIFYRAVRSTRAEKLSADHDFFYVVRKRIRSILYDNLSEKAYSFIVGMVLGDSTALSDTVRENFGAAGVSHVFAVSGLHVTFFALIISALLSLIKIKRLKKDVVVLILTLLYSGVCGFPVSSLRAVITFFVLGVARSLGFKRDALSSAFFALTVVLLFMPTSIFTFGFMLSFAAVIGVAVLGNSFKELFSFMPGVLSSAFSVALSAFLFTAPIVARIMGTVSVITVLANVIVVPVVTVLFYITVFIILAVSVAPALSGAFVISEAITDLVIDLVMKVDFGRFLLRGYMSTFNIAVYYTLLIVSSDKVDLPVVVKRIAAAVTPISLFLFI